MKLEIYPVFIYHSFLEICDTCEGHGFLNHTKHKCHSCRGNGFIEYVFYLEWRKL